jgi:hypothetical protein
MGANTLNKNKRKKPNFKQSNWCLYQYLPIKKNSHSKNKKKEKEIKIYASIAMRMNVNNK